MGPTKIIYINMNAYMAFMHLRKNLEYFLHKAVVADGRRSPPISGSVDLEKGDFVLEYQLYIYMDG